jgi:hypothetical protein
MIDDARMRLMAMLMAIALMLVPVAVARAKGAAPQHPPAPPAAQHPAPPDPLAPYHTLLAKMCAAKHLEWLSPGELDDLIEVNFHDALPGALQSKLDEADGREKAACANTVGGLACFNAAYLRAMDDVKLLPRFARMVCDSGVICRAPVECGRQ